ncbi:hypothetical protein [Streptomyces sp. NPDC051129]|uniref:hypothetical protein n=1 Tax=Streptomyces sp. NPDC051129 TaxID=3154639 RepID=UPI003443D56F
METTSPKVPQLAPEQILRAADYLELVWQGQKEKASLEEFGGQAPTLRIPHLTGIRNDQQPSPPDDLKTSVDTPSSTRCPWYRYTISSGWRVTRASRQAVS